MTIRHLRIFLYVCETLNMTAAGAKLNMSQPSVSQCIKEMEEYFQVILFERFPRKLYITEAGEKLKDYATHMLTLFDEAEQKIKKTEAAGVIRIGANLTIGTALIHQYIKAFEEKYPSVDVVVTVCNSVRIEEMLNKNELDLALMEETIRDSYLNVEVFGDDRIVVIAYPEHKLCKTENIFFSDIVNEKLLLREKGAGVRDKFEHLSYVKGFKITPLWESTSTTALVNAVKEKVGLAVVPYQLVKKELEAGTVRELKLEDANLNRHLTIVTSKHKYLTEPVKAFMALMKRPE